MKLIWSPLALNRLEEIIDYIALDSTVNADRFADIIFHKIELLIKFPETGRIVPELNNNSYRELIFGNYRIIYKTIQNNIHVLTIRHSKRLLDKEEVEKLTL